MRNRCCCNCRHDIRVWEDGNCTTHCEIDGHYIGYIQCFDGWCRHWAKDNLGKHGQQRKVICVDDGTMFGSYNEAGKHYGISPMTVKSCCERKSKGKVKTFRYADGERGGE